jgi:hypothetical protein
VDAQFISDGLWGLGLILRREDGSAVAVATKVVRNDGDAKVAKALEIREALRFIHMQRLSSITVESDAQGYITTLYAKSFDRNYWGKIIHSYSQIGSYLDKVAFKWTKRCNNHTTHEIAAGLLLSRINVGHLDFLGP